MIRERDGVRDEISDVIGDPRYAMNYYPPGLKEVTVGPHSLDLVNVSRYYFKVEPKIVVDFEPSPLDRKMWLDQKREYFFKLGVVYVPVFLKERLTPEAFKARIAEEAEFMRTGTRQRTENWALGAVTIDDVLQSLPPDRNVEEALHHPVTVQWIDQETLRIHAERLKTRPNVRGAARQRMLENIKRQVIVDLREKVKHGRMGRQHSHREPAVAAGG